MGNLSPGGQINTPTIQSILGHMCLNMQGRPSQGLGPALYVSSSVEHDSGKTHYANDARLYVCTELHSPANYFRVKRLQVCQIPSG